jgi:hypothetical protein
LKTKTDQLTSIYCHFDGYISGVGKLLKEYYTTQAKVEALIELGDISSLDITPSSTSAYHRDRNEEFSQQTNKSVPDLFNCIYQSGEEFIYCFTKDNIWLVSDSGPVVDLKVAIEEGL